MTTNILLPLLTPTMEDATLVSWSVKEGDSVATGDVLASIEADKAVIDIEAVEEGVILQILVAEGTEGVKVDSVIAVIGAEGETVPEIRTDVTGEAALSIDKPATDTDSTDETAAAVGGGPVSQERVFASPLARSIAADADVELENIRGTGSNGRILKIDVLEYIGEFSKSTYRVPSSDKASGAVEVPADIPMEEVRLSNIRKVIAERLQSSKQSVPHFYLTVDIELEELLAMRSRLNARPDAKKMSVNDFVVRAVALALRQVPEANVQFSGDKLIHFKRADVSVAVALDNGLVTPVIRGAENKNLDEISHEIRMLAESARAGDLPPEAYQGGTFTVSNLGMYGIKQFDAIINAPQAGILAVGKCEARAVVSDGQIIAANMMTVTLSCDHRAIDGAVGAKFLATVRDFLQNPLQLLTLR
jgi:pyruvate dehydrogenase E2 component (dihydrolipoamide acetyltransferase)